MNGWFLLGLKAEMVLGAYLVLRNRSVRLAAALALVVAVLALTRHLGNTTFGPPQNTVFLIAGTLAALSGARLLAPGPALAASRRVAAVWWLIPFGRLSGAMVVVVPVSIAAALSLGLASAGVHWATLGVTAYSTATAALVLFLSPVVGASAASAIGVATVWVGMVHTDSMNAIHGQWPFVRIPAGVLSRVLPLPWRAQMVVELHSVSALLLFLGWTVVGVAAAGLVAGTFRSFGLLRSRGEP